MPDNLGMVSSFSKLNSKPEQRSYKKIVSRLFAASLLLSGCSLQQSSSVDYVQQPVPIAAPIPVPRYPGLQLNRAVKLKSSPEIPCAAGTDQGTKTGYAHGAAYVIRLCDVEGSRINSQMSANLGLLFDSARKAGINNLTTDSDFRDNSEQKYLYNCFVRKNCNHNIEAAKPGYSNHQMGLALDFAEQISDLKVEICSPLPPEGCNNKANDFLNAEASNYGFLPLAGEPWHRSYNGQ